MEKQSGRLRTSSGSRTRPARSTTPSSFGTYAQESASARSGAAPPSAPRGREQESEQDRRHRELEERILKLTALVETQNEQHQQLRKDLRGRDAEIAELRSRGAAPSEVSAREYHDERAEDSKPPLPRVPAEGVARAERAARLRRQQRVAQLLVDRGGDFRGPTQPPKGYAGPLPTPCELAVACGHRALARNCGALTAAGAGAAALS